jgi:hypothetical protein
VANYVEPFFGSGAVLLARPEPQGTETVNDMDGNLANAWRAIQSQPEATARWADWPVSECDLHARHLWLLDTGQERSDRLMADPNWCDPKAAGWWIWGLCSWIGSGFCNGDGPWVSDGERLVKRDAGRGIRRKRPHLGDAGRGIHRKRPHLGNAGRGIHRDEGAPLLDYFTDLSERLRDVRVCCGDWSRVCGPSVTYKHGLTAVFLDPPYTAVREAALYRADSMEVGHAAFAWAVENGDNPLMRIALCGYEGEYEIPKTWETVAWKATGGFGSQGDGRGRENAARERIWFSPNCLGASEGLFAAMTERDF